MTLETVVVPDIHAVALVAAQKMKGPRIGFSGGSTFAALFPLWREIFSTRLKAGEPLSCFPVDERKVAYDEDGCNWRVCSELLLEPVGLGGQKSHHPTSLAEYQSLLQAGLGPDKRFDSVFLGMGTDGHTASLFPGTEALDDLQSLVLETTSPKPPFPRLTLGLRSLWESHELIAIITGKDKSEMVRRLKSGDMSLPITRALQGHARPVLILDEAAAN